MRVGTRPQLAPIAPAVAAPHPSGPATWHTPRRGAKPWGLAPSSIARRATLDWPPVEHSWFALSSVPPGLSESRSNVAARAARYWLQARPQWLRRVVGQASRLDP